MNFRPMRRKRQELPKEECEKILNNATAAEDTLLRELTKNSYEIVKAKYTKK